jgi:acyl dehydratase
VNKVTACALDDIGRFLPVRNPLPPAAAPITYTSRMAKQRLDFEAVGLPLPLAPIEIPVTTELVKRLVDGLGEDCPGSVSLMEAGLAPPQSLTGNTIVLVSSHYVIAGGVYWREQVTYSRPPRIGEVMTVAGRVLATYVKDGRHYNVMESSTKAADGSVLAASRSTGLTQYKRSEAPGDSGPPDDLGPGPEPFSDRAQNNPSRDKLRALSAGFEVAGRPRTITLEMMRALAAEDTANPIHTDEKAAKEAGLAAPIAGGPHVLAAVQEAMMEELGPESLLHGAHFDVQWVAPVFAGSEVATKATLVEAADDLVTFELSVEADGRKAMVGAARIPV